MNKEDLGTYFIKDGELYHCIAYTDRPTVNLKNINTGQIKSVVCDSAVAREYSKLYKVQVGDEYNLDLAEPVENIMEVIYENK